MLRDVGREWRYRATRSHASSTRTSSLVRPVATNHERQAQTCGDIRRFRTLPLGVEGRVISSSLSPKSRWYLEGRMVDLKASPRAEEIPDARVNGPCAFVTRNDDLRDAVGLSQVEVASSDARTARPGMGPGVEAPSIRHQVHRFGEVGPRMTRCVYLMHPGAEDAAPDARPAARPCGLGRRDQAGVATQVGSSRSSVASGNDPWPSTWSWNSRRSNRDPSRAEISLRSCSITRWPSL